MPELVTFRKLEPNLPIEFIDVADENVRHTQLDFGIEELKTSIERLGLIHPVIVIPIGHRFRLVVGQRRYRAFLALGRPTIPALIIRSIDKDSQRLVSFSENIHRRNLPYDDTIAVCDYLFQAHKGPKTAKIETIARELNISVSTVRKYLAYRLVPEPVQKLVRERELSAEIAYRITEVFWPNAAIITEIAKRATLLTKSEKNRLIEIGKRNPNAPIDSIIEAAQKALPYVEISIYIEPETMTLLEKEANKRKTDVQTMIKGVVDDWVREEGIK
ncbi:MAG: ParB/RepB/Spo0J family partition protein [Thermoplasmata archaeon]|nr:ParB/RepB/Spo0J family partition protein [Thermoplasmata archaeon]MCI4359135.1 ParB/RepB/Spo0J family partition protein [Thermoplasmata archaeon]